jgi:predicted DNA-binding transcriptional regulator AlpA
MSGERVLRISEVATRIGVSTQTITRWSKRGHFPSPVKLGPADERTAASGFLASEVDDWITRQVAAQRRAP